MDLVDKTIVITGANSGIGLETARALAASGARIVMACRDAARAEAARADIAATTDAARLEVVPLDLAALGSVRRCAADLVARHPRIDILINNAGLFPFRKRLTADGFEMQFGVNHLGHFLLTQSLMPSLQAAGAPRVINVASMMHHLGKLDFDSFRGEKPYKPIRAYGQSKLCNVLFTRELARRHQDDGLLTWSLHPGPVGTNIMGRSLAARTLYRLVGAYMSPRRGARTSVWLAGADGIEATSGSYYDEYCKVKPGSKLSQDMALAARLWETSERLVAG
ncbi:MAG: SDR family oxidoreductase [Gammaproteobacteria bacterium]|nr:SDR family oxidoreductase [Gammaproteobacteria bacterium]MCP5202229.1 SDR family oxidoreductase [Gammaproteobacteria bacterium]